MFLNSVSFSPPLLHCHHVKSLANTPPIWSLSKKKKPETLVEVKGNGCIFTHSCDDFKLNVRTAKIENYKAKIWQQNTRRGINSKNSLPGVWWATINSWKFSLNNSSGKSYFSISILCGAHIPLLLDKSSHNASEACLWLLPFSNNTNILKKYILFHLTRCSMILILPVPLRERVYHDVKPSATWRLHKQHMSFASLNPIHCNAFQSDIYYSFLQFGFLHLLKRHISSKEYSAEYSAGFSVIVVAKETICFYHSA